MNENFYCIKVDREERPDVDQIYMTAAHIIAGNGGWPLNCFALPDSKPFHAGTYYPAAGWLKLLQTVHDQYQQNREKLNDYATRLTKGIRLQETAISDNPTEKLDAKEIVKTVENWKTSWDMTEGGINGAPKFPMPSNLHFLMDYTHQFTDTYTDTFIQITLEKMAYGGIFDQLAGGFSRYSVDALWKAPHFEKMLYDNAQLIQLYSKAFKFFKKEPYKEVVAQTYDFLEREMKLPKGGYAAALDADFNGEEGLFYVWTPQELKALISGRWELFSAYYGLLENDLWEDRYWILKAPEDTALFKATHGLTQESFEALQSEWKQLLLRARNERGAPLRDHKLITSWNALLVSGYAEAYNAFGDSRYLEAATQLYELISAQAPEELRHIYKAGEATPVFTQDYVLLSQAALALYFSTNNSFYLDAAENNMTYLNSRFYHAEKSAYAFGDTAELMAPLYVFSDGVMPSDNGVAAQVNFLIGHIKFNSEATKKAAQTMQDAQNDTKITLPLDCSKEKKSHSLSFNLH